jgi:hypothetical protein
MACSWLRQEHAARERLGGVSPQGYEAAVECFESLHVPYYSSSLNCAGAWCRCFSVTASFAAGAALLPSFEPCRGLVQVLDCDCNVRVSA